MSASISDRTRSQFTLGALFEWVTVAALMLTLAPLVGLPASLLLMGFWIALTAMRGETAVAAFSAAIALAGAAPAVDGFLAIGAAILAASGILVWCATRRAVRETSLRTAPRRLCRAAVRGELAGARWEEW